jgi:hypothetical protein
MPKKCELIKIPTAFLESIGYEYDVEPKLISLFKQKPSSFSNIDISEWTSISMGPIDFVSRIIIGAKYFIPSKIMLFLQ